MKLRTKAPRELAPFKVWSNSFYWAPFLVAAYYGLWPTAILCVAVGVFGTFYHLHRESRNYLWPDCIASWLLIATNLVLCYLGHFKAPYFWIALLFLGFSLFYSFYLERRSQYGLNHGLWHLYGALITLFCVFTYVL